MYLIRDNPVCPRHGIEMCLIQNHGVNYFRCTEHPVCRWTISPRRAYAAQVKADKDNERVKKATQAIMDMRK